MGRRALARPPCVRHWRRSSAYTLEAGTLRYNEYACTGLVIVKECCTELNAARDCGHVGFMAFSSLAVQVDINVQLHIHRFSAYGFL